jgi:SAM-dependent methyltransferase
MKSEGAGGGEGVSFFRAPAVLALLIQAASFAAALGLAGAGIIPFSPGALSAALLQGAIAALLSRLRRLAWWWVPIQFFFPVVLVLVLRLHLPPWIFLALFLVLLPLYWTTFRTQVPFFPSRPATWQAVLRLMPANRAVRFIDIGSGFGGLAMHLALARPENSIRGIEVAPLPWVVSAMRARLSRSRAQFLRGDYSRLDFSNYDMVFAYLSPTAMPSLWRKARAEMSPGSLLLSYEFLVPGVEPDIVVEVADGGPSLYGWRIGRSSAAASR